MILYGEDHWIRGRDESTSIDSLNDGAEWNFCGEGMTMVNQWRTIVTVPTIKLHATATSQQDLMTQFSTRSNIAASWTYGETLQTLIGSFILPENTVGPKILL